MQKRRQRVRVTVWTREKCRRRSPFTIDRRRPARGKTIDMTGNNKNARGVWATTGAFSLLRPAATGTEGI